MQIFHKPVLLRECIEYLKPDKDNSFLVDATLGEGGHSEAFLQKYSSLKVLGIDADAAIQKHAKERLNIFGNRIQFYLGWSDTFFLEYPSSMPKPDIILIDLGISVFHYSQSARGFSFSATEPLDMRLDSSMELTAADIVNTYSEKKLADLFYNFGEEKFSKRIASAVLARRITSPFREAKELADCIAASVPSFYRYGKIHPATKTFQALRIAVNRELERLPVLLKAAFDVLAPNGRLGVISFHSLEDRIVKLYFRELGKRCICPQGSPVCTCGKKSEAEVITKKAVIACDEEIKMNPPSRSARLRVVRKVLR